MKRAWWLALLTLASLVGCQAPAPVAGQAIAKKPYVILIGGFDSSPTERQIAGTARRGEGVSGLYQLRDDFRRAGVRADHFNWNGTTGRAANDVDPPMQFGIAQHIRAVLAMDPNLEIHLVGYSWGGHTAYMTAEELSKIPGIPVASCTFVDPSSLFRGGTPNALPSNVDHAVNYYTGNLIGWRRWNVPRVRNVALGDPSLGYALRSGPRSRYGSSLDMPAHLAAEWDPRIHEETLQRVASQTR